MGRRRGGWGEGEEVGGWVGGVAVATRGRLVSSDPSVGVSLCLLATILSPAKDTKDTEYPGQP